MSWRISKAVRAALWVSTAGVASLAADVRAQQAGDPAQEQFRLETVIVTATRREEGLQDVPVAVTAVSGEALAQSNFREVTDLQYLAPNVTFSSTNPVSNGGGYQIRGVGTQTYDSGVEQTVGLVVDGVVIGTSRDPGATGFSDIERVEVLRGPQGTLFGKNSSAGVIQIVTKDPKLRDTSGDLSLSYGEREEQIARGNVNVPLGESAALRVSGYYQAQDGAIPYLVRDGNVGDRENSGVRAKLLWWATDQLSFLVSAEHQDGFARDAHTIESLGTSALFNSQFAAFDVRPGHGVYKSYQDGDWTADTRVDAASLKVDYTIGSHTLTSISAYRQVETLQLSDIDAAPVNIFNNSDGGVDNSQFTQELRLTSPSGERLEYVLGAYYFETDSSGWAAQVGNYYGLFGVPVVLGGGRRDQTGTNESIAAFGHATFGLTDSLKLIAGLRYTHDEVTAKMVVTPLPFPAAPIGVLLPYDGKVKDDNISGRVGLQYEPATDVMLYVTYATGYKGPAIDGTGGIARKIEPETVDSYEAGVKSTLFDGRMTLNAALYWSDFSDFQAQALDLNTSPPSFALSNAGLMRSRGVELESSMQVTAGLELSLGATYSDAQFEEYEAACYAGQPASSVVGVGCYLDPETGLRVANYAGERLPNAPEWTYLIRGNYERSIGASYAIDASLNWAWRSEAQAVTADPKARIEDYGILNASVGFGRDDGAWRIGIYARNALDERFYAPYASGTLNPGGYYRIVSPDAFRTVGVNVTAKF
ncbi:iron complex outermembrane receptor protein [Povalibacter uvarum]|uniref:Iron complex outermembrane receptor protein n=1 Tax=Povalibacter uvarum TaxID=732238 RepID=A0A841HF58_9GAMM|nr:TonB-dependent receptor [Povalibacter uvarum]MBB6091214.1 iron complex outermembrane receptor protein [Povalibacter uvarum]